MRVTRAKFEVVTPMFLGGANHIADTIRPPSVKGALRFWWRAMNWPLYTGKGKENGLKALHTKETKLFGGASQIKDGNEVGGQGQCLLNVIPQKVTVLDNHGLDRILGNDKGIHYLLGQGLYRHNQGFSRNAIAPGSLFTVELVWKKKATDEDIDSVEDALMVFGLIGGLGSRVRRGFGSVALRQFDSVLYNVEIPTTEDQWRAQVGGLLPEHKSGHELPPYTAVSNHLRIKIESGQSWLNLLKQEGKRLHDFRNNIGEGGRKFPRDYDNAKAVTEGDKPPEVPARAVFGLPHNYYFRSTKLKVDIDATGEKRTRRASPLMIHVHSFPDGTGLSARSSWPADFLPLDDKIRMKSRAGQYSMSFTPKWKLIRG